ncbi:hypothetical protein FW778_03665 [Ginsengibacter hankyongi]|uniref:Dipeptidylpeptidase IV N-terminal domain-containing protein n=1 Tax=Ginsengibacter hankyongi TaxID=2607284 RepID=A0A5J5IJJ4_9BACT|nr:hypothetical protein [Ginsengibacter hankyongi]KAA9041146.1 hypothetical protein FW778_03665 [Ginsengibacter hankyongi]
MPSPVKLIAILILSFVSILVNAQPPQGIHWSKDGNSYYEVKNGEIIQNDSGTAKSTIVVTMEQLTSPGESTPLSVRNFFFSNDGTKILIYTNSMRVWRYEPTG